jgi:hypothetical protein
MDEGGISKSAICEGITVELYDDGHDAPDE